MAAALGHIPFREIWGFALVGAFGIIADIGTFNVCVLAGMPPVPASFLGFSLGVIVSFLGNKILTFRHRSVTHLGRAWTTFVVINVVALGFIQLVVWAGDAAGLALIGLNVVRTVAIGIATVGRFFAYRRWVFTEPQSTPVGR